MKKFAIIFLLAVLLPGCASMRKINVGSDSANTYSVDVHNSHSATLSVSYADSRGSHALGSVQGGRTERFIVAGSDAATVTITGRTSGGASYSKTVTLSAGGSTAITL